MSVYDKSEVQLVTVFCLTAVILVTLVVFSCQADSRRQLVRCRQVLESNLDPMAKAMYVERNCKDNR